MGCGTPGFPVLHQLPELTQPHVQKSVMSSNHFIFCRPLLFPSSIFLSIRLFSNELVLRIRWSKYWSFSFSPSNEYSELISFRINWLDLLAVQGTLKESSRTPQLKSINPTLTSIHDYWKSHSSDQTTFVGKVMSLLFNMLPRLVITFLPMSKYLLILWRQSPSAVILEPPKIKSVTISIVSPSICHEVMGPDAMILVF